MRNNERIISLFEEKILLKIFSSVIESKALVASSKIRILSL